MFVGDSGMPIGYYLPKQDNHVNNPTSSCPAANVLGVLQINRLVRKNLKIMIALFLIAIAVFIYMIYVLIKPENF